MQAVKPPDVIGRDSEWAALSEFAADDSPPGAVGLVYGRRRTGKSFLLRRLIEAAGGVYFQATESERTDALAEFGQAIALSQQSDPAATPEPIAYGDWSDALARRSGLVVIDEFPYLLRHSPELPSLLQRFVDEASNGGRAPIRFVVCGSSLSVMTSLLRGQEPLRGRATLDLLLRPMDHREAAVLWGVDDLEVAVRLHALLGGAPGHRALTRGAPRSVGALGEWLSHNVLDPAHALYREDDYLLQEERTITDRALYGSILRAVANGVATQTELAGRLKRSRESMQHPIDTLVRAGFLTRRTDVLSGGRPELRIADPIIRFIRLVVDPARSLLDEGRWKPVWDRAQHRLDANVYGAHLESIAQRWTSLNYEPRDGLVTNVGHARVADPRTKTALDLDLVAVGPGADDRTAVHVVAEVKWSPSGFGADAVNRLARARDLLGAQGHDVSRCELALISRTRPDHPGEGHRIDLVDLYR
jgi:AAA+ ATPase superfamily predicted ATPase